VSRLDDLVRFHGLLEALARRLGGPRRLAECHGRMAWPQRGVYFFLDPDEPRTDTEPGPRVVRVGTHALTKRSRTTLWQRLSQHRGPLETGAGNHRGSIFRLLVGNAMMARDRAESPATWSLGADPGAAARTLGLTRVDVLDAEAPLERRVSSYIGALPFLWLAVDDAPGPASLRGVVERGAIALLSNFGRPGLDLPGPRWLGLHSDRDRVRRSGVWNNNHVDEPQVDGFLDTMERLIERA